MSERILIFDGLNTFLRNYMVNPHMDVNGNPVGGLIGTIKSIKSAVADFKPTRVFFVWDGAGGSKRRRTIYSEYKMGRKPRFNREFDDSSVGESRANLDFQKEKLAQLLGLLGVIQIEIGDIEADDTIGYLVGYMGESQKVIVSSDKDMWQLVSPNTHVYWPTKKVYITDATFKDQSECLPQNYVIMRSLEGKGDSSDNISGIKGLGEKTILKVFPFLKERPIELTELFDFCRKGVEVQDPKQRKGNESKIRWMQAVLDQKDVVITNHSLMQLSTPIISASSAAKIRQIVDESRPQLNLTSFRISLLNNGIQLTDNDLTTVFTEYKMRSVRESGA